MLAKIIGITVFLSILTIGAFAGDFGAGNGGDTVTCNSNSIYKGTYFLDYLSALIDSPNADFYSSTDEVINLLRSKIPTLAIKLETISNAFETGQKKGQYVWKDVAPIEYADEDLSFKIPNGCEAAPTQLILRKSYNKNRVYLFAEKWRLKNLAEQKSWAFLHEALWDIYDSAFEIRIVNEFIHNKENSKLSSKEFIEELNNAVSSKRFIDADSYKIVVDAENALLKYDDPNVFRGKAIDLGQLSPEEKRHVVELARKYFNLLSKIFVKQYSDMDWRIDRVYNLSAAIILDNR